VDSLKLDSRIIVGGFLVALGIIIALFVSGVVPSTVLSGVIPMVIAYIIIAIIICIGLAVIILGKKEREIEEV